MKSIPVLAALAAMAIPGFAADAKAGEAVYMRACKMCHGAEGHGNAVIAKALNVTQPDLATVKDDEVKNAVTNGKGKMKAVSSVAENEIPDLVAFIHTFAKK